MKREYVYWSIPLLGILLAVLVWQIGFTAPRLPLEKIYVALEGEGSVAVIDSVRNKVLTKISLTHKQTGTEYMPHNVQVSSDQSMVWVTANVSMDMARSFRFMNTAYADEGHEDIETMSDQVIIIDPVTDSVVRRIPIGVDQHLSHVVVSPDGRTVYVASQTKDKLYVIDAKTMMTTKSIDLPPKSGPHGMRLSPDGTTLYLAFTTGKALGIVDVVSGKIKNVSLDGTAVQTAVTPDGSKVAVSVYDSKSVGVYNVLSRSLAYVRLPEGSYGPVQLYPTSDSRFVYVVDQGVLQNRPSNNKVYKINLATLSIEETIEAGHAPHGIVLSTDDTRAYVTNLKSDSVSVIDTISGKETAEVFVGKEPNGISIWNTVEQKIGRWEKMLLGAEITVYKSPTCGCCGNYISELKRHGAKVTVREMPDDQIALKKRELGIPGVLQSCHTSVMDGYVIEGHVPIEALAKIRTEHPDISGIALPGMPSGSPGMSGVKTGPFVVQTFDGKLYGNF